MTSDEVKSVVEKQVINVVSRGFGIIALRDEIDTAIFLVHRNDAVPVSVEERFYTVADDQDTIRVRVFEQGGAEESPRPEDNTVLVEGEITGLPPGYPRGTEITMRMSMGGDGILTVTAHHVARLDPLKLVVETGPGDERGRGGRRAQRRQPAQEQAVTAPPFDGTAYRRRRPHDAARASPAQVEDLFWLAHVPREVDDEAADRRAAEGDARLPVQGAHAGAPGGGRAGRARRVAADRGDAARRGRAGGAAAAARAGGRRGTGRRRAAEARAGGRRPSPPPGQRLAGRAGAAARRPGPGQRPVRVPRPADQRDPRDAGRADREDRRGQPPPPARP